MTAIAAKSKFLFDLDFGAGNPAERPVPPAEHARKLAETESKGYRDGFAAAEKERVAEAEQRTAAAFQRISEAIEQIARGLGELERRHAAESIEVAAAVARKLAPALVAREPFAEIEALAANCLRQLVASPHVVIRVNDALYATARERLEDIARARGFEGRLVVMAEPDITVGDCRIEWADGGLTRDQAAADAAIAEAVSRYLGARPAALPEARPTTLPELGEIAK